MKRTTSLIAFSFVLLSFAVVAAISISVSNQENTAPEESSASAMTYYDLIETEHYLQKTCDPSSVSACQGKALGDSCGNNTGQCVWDWNNPGGLTTSPEGMSTDCGCFPKETTVCNDYLGTCNELGLNLGDSCDAQIRRGDSKEYTPGFCKGSSTYFSRLLGKEVMNCGCVAEYPRRCSEYGENISDSFENRCCHTEADLIECPQNTNKAGLCTFPPHSQTTITAVCGGLAPTPTQGATPTNTPTSTPSPTVTIQIDEPSPPYPSQADTQDSTQDNTVQDTPVSTTDVPSNTAAGQTVTPTTGFSDDYEESFDQILQNAGAPELPDNTDPSSLPDTEDDSDGEQTEDSPDYLPLLLGICVLLGGGGLLGLAGYMYYKRKQQSAPIEQTPDIG